MRLLYGFATVACAASPLYVWGAVPTGVGDTFQVTQIASHSSCTVEVLGCFYDKKWGDCRYLLRSIFLFELIGFVSEC